MLRHSNFTRRYGEFQVRIVQNPVFDAPPITFEAEQPLLALMYSENDLQVRAVQEFAAGSVSPVNDYAYYISLEFCKAEQ